MKRLLLLYSGLVFLAVFQLSCPYGAFAQQHGSPAPDFELTDLNGKIHRLSGYRGKVVVLNFWASWCPECLEEMPSLNAFYEKNSRKDIVVLGVTADRKKETVLTALRKVPVAYPVLLEPGGGVFIRKYTVIGMPTTVLIDRNGIIADRIVGRTDFGSASFSGKVMDILNKGRTQ